MAKLTLQVKIIIAVAAVAVCSVTGGLIYHFTADNKPEEPKETTSVAAEETEAETETEAALETETETEAETEDETEKATEKQTEKATEKATKSAPKPTKPAAAKPAATTEKATKAPNKKEVTFTVRIAYEDKRKPDKNIEVKTTATNLKDALIENNIVVFNKDNSIQSVLGVKPNSAKDEWWCAMPGNDFSYDEFVDLSKYPVKSGDQLTIVLFTTRFFG